MDMRSVSLAVFMLLIFTLHAMSQTPAELAEIWEKEHVSNKLPSNTRHKDLLVYLDGLKKLGLDVARSAAAMATGLYTRSNLDAAR